MRDLALAPFVYPCLTHFFRAKSWNWYSLSCTWAEIVADIAPLKRIAGRVVLIGDGVKRASDGKKKEITITKIISSKQISLETFSIFLKVTE